MEQLCCGTAVRDRGVYHDAVGPRQFQHALHVALNRGAGAVVIGGQMVAVDKRELVLSQDRGRDRPAVEAQRKNGWLHVPPFP